MYALIATSELLCLFRVARRYLQRWGANGEECDADPHKTPLRGWSGGAAGEAKASTRDQDAGASRDECGSVVMKMGVEIKKLK